MSEQHSSYGSDVALRQFIHTIYYANGFNLKVSKGMMCAVCALVLGRIIHMKT